MLSLGVGSVFERMFLMFVNIINGYGTGSQVVNHWDSPGDGEADVIFLEKVDAPFSCKKIVQRKTFISLDFPTHQLPTLYIGWGGVGSIVDHPREEEQLLCGWNWSGRVFQWVILNPIAIVTGRDSDTPNNLDGHHWVLTYCGNTIREWVLVALDEDGFISNNHVMPTVECKGIYPPSEKAEVYEHLLYADENNVLHNVDGAKCFCSHDAKFYMISDDGYVLLEHYAYEKDGKYHSEFVRSIPESKIYISGPNLERIPTVGEVPDWYWEHQ